MCKPVLSFYDANFFSSNRKARPFDECVCEKKFRRKGFAKKSWIYKWSHIMNIRKANIEDAKRIFSFVKEAVNKMDGQGIKQWDEFYPTQVTITL